VRGSFGARGGRDLEVSNPLHAWSHPPDARVNVAASRPHPVDARVDALDARANQRDGPSHPWDARSHPPDAWSDRRDARSIGVMGVPLCERGARIFFIDARIPWMHA